jgi:hypothetical protein
VAVFVDIGTDRRDFSDLVSQRVGVVSLKRGATSLALCRLDLEGLSKLFGWDQRSDVAFVTGLSSALAPDTDATIPWVGGKRLRLAFG